MQAEQVQALARTLSALEFCKRFSGFYLAVAFGEVPLELGFRTATAGVTVNPCPVGLTEVLPIAKAFGNPYPDRVSLGRSRNCDVVVRQPSVSKLHAYFLLKDEVPHQLLDFGSNNGSLLNGRKLLPHTPERVRVGDSVHFGQVAATVVDGSSLLAVLRET